MALKNFIKENVVLVIGMALPVLLVGLFFVASALPKSMATPPEYEMLFTTWRYDQNTAAYNVDFFVKDGTLTGRVSKTAAPQQHYNIKRMMAFNGKTQSVREINYNMSEIGEVPNGSEVVFSAFRDMKVDSSNKAPDGYEFDNPGYSSGGLATELFWGGSRHHSARVKKGAASFKIPNGSSQGYPYYDVQFVGWLIGKQGD